MSRPAMSVPATTDGPPHTRLSRWSTPGPPRVLAAALLLLTAVASVPATAVIGHLVGVQRAGGMQAVLWFTLPSLGTVAAALAVAAYLLTGSVAARVLGAVAAVGLSLPVLSYVFQIARLQPQSFMLFTAGAALPTAAVVLALAVPSRREHLRQD